MDDYRFYMPILKWRMGEYKALRELAPDVRSSMIPLIEIPQRPWNFETEEYGKTLDDHLARRGEEFASMWGSEKILIDADLLSPTETMSTGMHALEFLFEELRGVEVQAVPVTGPGRDEAYQLAVRDIVARDGRGACIRLSKEEVASAPVLRSLLGFTQGLGLEPESVDLVLDLGPLTEPEVLLYRNLLPILLEAVPSVAHWRTLTLASGAFPINLSGYKPGVIPLPRHDWTLWEELTSAPAELARTPSFGDYAISHPRPEEIDPRIMAMSASIRYTSEDHWMVFRGRSVRVHGHEQFPDLCRQIIDHPCYYRSSHCHGDNHIDQCANGATGVGNATTWRMVGTNHHLTFAARQVASRPVADA